MSEMDNELLTIFKHEANTHINRINQMLLEMESGTGDNFALCDASKREIHTLKGSARMLGLRSISNAAHFLESVFESFVTSRKSLSSDMVTNVLQNIDKIKEAVDILPQKEVEVEINNIYAPQPGEEAGNEDFASRKEDADNNDQKVTKESEVQQEAKTVESSSSSPNSVAANDSEVVILKFEKMRRLLNSSNVFTNYAAKFDYLHQQLAELVEEMSGENISSQARLEKLLADFKYELRFYNISANQLQDDVSSMLLVPLSVVFDLMPRLVRDVALSRGKEVRLKIEGRGIEIDKQLIDEIKVMLIHILRNAIDHGIESVEARKEKGKPAAGEISLSAQAMGDRVRIEVRDDGKGINIQHVREKAIAQNLISASDAAKLSEKEIAQFIFSPGFSTAKKVTNISGRGVGMDVVAETMKKYNSSVDVSWVTGGGTTFCLDLPVNASVMSVTMFSLFEQLYALPSLHIDTILELYPALVRDMDGRKMINFKQKMIPLLDLAQLLKLECSGKLFAKDKITVIVIETARGYIGLGVEAILLEKKMVIKQLTGLREKMSSVGGLVMLASKVVTVLNPSTILAG